jgi:hypothetical protein
MKPVKCLFPVALFGAIWTGVAGAQTRTERQLLQPDSLRAASYDNTYTYSSTVNEADTAPVDPPGTAKPASDAALVAQDELTQPAAPPGPWKLPQPCFFQSRGIDVGGWIDQGITFNAQRSADGFNGPVALNDRNSEYMLNQAWLYLVKPTKTDGCGWDLGGRVDVVYGEDWRYGQSVGLEDRIDSPNSFYGLVLPQFYGEVAYNDLTVKIGHFASFSSYEVVPPPFNFFYSHSYLSLGYFDPMLLTGVQTEYKLNDRLTLINGVNNGWQVFKDPTDTLNYTGGIRWASNEKRATLSMILDTGRQTGFTGLHDRTSLITVCTYRLNEKLQYASQYTVGQEQGGSVVRRGEDAPWYGTEQMLILKLNPKWSAGLRYEWVRDQEGSRIAGIGGLLGTDKGWLGQPGFAGSFHDLSIGLNYRPNGNIVLRPELRWDWYNGPTNLAGQLPFNEFQSRNQMTAAMDLLVTF